MKIYLDTETGERVSEWKYRQRKELRKRPIRPFLALDGEAITLANGEHRYVMLCASTGEAITDAQGITTVAALRFLLDLRKRYPSHVMVSFYFNYDVAKILGDLEPDELAKLWADKWISVGPYRIQWIPSKWFMVTARNRKTGERRTARVYDTSGFFQTSFVKALATWGIDAGDEIVSGKAARGTFGVKDIPMMREYCHAECVRLVTLMDRLRESLHSVDLRPQGWHGPGAVAASLLKRENVKQARVTDGGFRNGELEGVFRQAYFGGRVELFRQGVFGGGFFNYDVNSAYPFHAIRLPDLRGKFEWCDGYDPTVGPVSVWHIRWNVGPDSIVNPFPYRRYRAGNVAIAYPTVGNGWYWNSEVAVALLRYPKGTIEVLGGWTFQPDYPEARPFAFIADEYRKRQELKAKGHAGERAIKLGINSVYGKLAQGVSSYGQGIPPFQSYIWAGLITSGTRAQMLELAHHAPDDVLMIATDGIFYQRDPELPTGKELGGLDKSVAVDAFLAQAGMYSCLRDGVPYARTRGHFAREIDFPTLRQEWVQRGPLGQYRTMSRRFVGVGACSGRGNWEHFGRWIDAPRTVSLMPSAKMVDLELCVDMIEKGETFTTLTHYPEGNDDWYEIESLPYKPKTEGRPAELAALVEAEEQPSPE